MSVLADRNNIAVEPRIRLLLVVLTACFTVSGCVTTPLPEVPFAASGTETVETIYYVNGNKKEQRTYKYGELQGAVTVWYSTGQKLTDTMYAVGVREGVTTFWWANGKIMSECEYKEDRKNGSYKSWDRNGQQKVKYVFVNDVFQGPFTVWWTNGQKKSEGTYNQGRLLGMYRAWDTNGILLVEREYQAIAEPPAPGEAVEAEHKPEIEFNMDL